MGERFLRGIGWRVFGIFDRGKGIWEGLFGVFLGVLTGGKGFGS